MRGVFYCLSCYFFHLFLLKVFQLFLSACYLSVSLLPCHICQPVYTCLSSDCLSSCLCLPQTISPAFCECVCVCLQLPLQLSVFVFVFAPNYLSCCLCLCFHLTTSPVVDLSVFMFASSYLSSCTVCVCVYLQLPLQLFICSLPAFCHSTCLFVISVSSLVAIALST